MLVRKVVQHGNAKGVDLPKLWLEEFQKKFGYSLEYVQIDQLASGSLQISPVIQREGPKP
jgi:hypothetical protein